MKKLIIEEHVEENVLGTLNDLGYVIIRGSDEEYFSSGSDVFTESYNEMIILNKLRHGKIRTILGEAQ